MTVLEYAGLMLPESVAKQLPEDTSHALVRAASKFYELAAALPSAGDDASADILLRIFDSPDWSSIGDAWDTTPKAEIFDRDHELIGATLHPSDYAGAMPVYAYVEAVDVKTGEKIGYANGGVFCLAQLAFLASTNKLEGVLVRLVKAQRASRSGYFPYHYVPLGHRG
jgi:hypothetical protein